MCCPRLIVKNNLDIIICGWKKKETNESICQKAEKHGSSLTHHTLNYNTRTLTMILSSINNVLGLKPGGPANWHLLQSCKHGVLCEMPHRRDLFLLVLCIISIILDLVSRVLHSKNHMSHVQIKIMASEWVFFFLKKQSLRQNSEWHKQTGNRERIGSRHRPCKMALARRSYNWLGMTESQDPASLLLMRSWDWGV